MRSSRDTPLLSTVGGTRSTPVPPAPRRLKTSSFVTFFNIIKAYLGTGLLVVPYGARCGGMWLSLAGIALLAAGSNHALKMLIRVKRRVMAVHGLSGASVTYDSLGALTFGKWGRRMALFAQLVTNLGICTGYMIFIGNTLLMVGRILGVNVDTLNPRLLPGGDNVRVNLIIVASFPLLAALALMRSMRRLGAASVVGTVAILVAIVAVIYTASAKISTDGPRHVPAARLETFPTFFGLLIFGFSIHGVVLPVEESMEHPEHAEVVLDLSIVCTVLIYGAFSILGYAAWGDGTASNILTNLPETTLLDRDIKMVTGVLLSVAMLLTVPLFFFAVFRVMEGPSAEAQRGGARHTKESIQQAAPASHGGDAVEDNTDVPIVLESKGDMSGFGGGLLSPPMPFAKLGSGASQESAPLIVDIRGNPTTYDNDNDRAESSAYLWWKVSGIRVLVVFGTLLLSLVLGPLFSEVISLVGAFSMSLVSFILPSAFYLRTMDGEGCQNRLYAWVILVLGVVALVVATTEAVSNMVYFFSHAGEERQCGSPSGNHSVNVSLSTTIGFW